MSILLGFYEPLQTQTKTHACANQRENFIEIYTILDPGTSINRRDYKHSKHQEIQIEKNLAS